MGRAGRGGGLGIGGILVLLVVSWLFGINPLTLLDGGDPSLPATDRAPDSGPVAQDEMSKFVRVVLADTEDTWNAAFKQLNRAYPEPVLVLFNGSINSACGFSSAASGPFYCPRDSNLYIDLSFYDELKRRFHAPGDFAQAYVIAHEVGHHVQNVLGTIDRAAQPQSNEASVRVELQADCFAGIWARDASDKGFLEAGDFDEAINAAAQIGDDAIQRRTQGRVVPESFNHGSSDQRMRWFKRGFETKSLKGCDTFSAERL
jgi:predicted metalloprotease